MNRAGLVLIHRVEHRWLSLAFLIGGGIVGFAPLLLAMKEDHHEWYGRLSWWAACSFTPFFIAALFYIGRTNALLHNPRDRVLVHVLGIYGRVTRRDIPYGDVREVRHFTQVIHSRRRGDSHSYFAELELFDGTVVRFGDDEQGPLALELARTLERPLQRTRGPSVAYEAFRWTVIAFGAAVLLLLFVVLCATLVFRR